MPTCGIVLAGTLILLAASQSYSQTTQANKDIALVKRDYYAVSYGMQLAILNAATQSGALDEAKIRQQLADVPVVVLSDFKAGPVSEILNLPLSNVLTAAGHDILHVEGDKAHWGPFEANKPQDSTMKVKDFLPGDVKRYVSYSVLVKFQGRSVAYRAMAVPTVNPDLPWFVLDGNMVAGWSSYPCFSRLYAPDSILNSKWRNAPVIHDWLSSHTVPDDSCTEDGLCCVESQCGLKLSEFQRKMAAPITTPNSAMPVNTQPVGAVVKPDSGIFGDCNSPETCSCWPSGSCVTIYAPYPEPPAQCNITFHYRLWQYAESVPTPFYHTWIVAHVQGQGGSASEIFDAVYQNYFCPVSACGNLWAFANPNHGAPYNGLDGDVAGLGTWPGGSTGTSADICENVLELQAWESAFPSNTPYITFSRNSNSFTSSAAAAVWLTPPPPPVPSIWLPGWGTPVP